MKDDTLKVTKFINKESWRKFVYNHPNGNIFQTPEMAEVYRQTKNYEPISLAVVDENDEILAILLAVVIREMKGILGSFSSRSIIEGGPLFVEGKKGLSAVSLLVEEYNKIAKKCALYSEIRNIHDVSHLNLFFERNGYSFEDHLNFLVDICSRNDYYNLQSGGERSRRRQLKPRVARRAPACP